MGSRVKLSKSCQNLLSTKFHFSVSNSVISQNKLFNELKLEVHFLVKVNILTEIWKHSFIKQDRIQSGNPGDWPVLFCFMSWAMSEGYLSLIKHTLKDAVTFFLGLCHIGAILEINNTRCGSCHMACLYSLTLYDITYI